MDINVTKKIALALSLSTAFSFPLQAEVISWTNIVSVGDRTFSGVKTYDGTYDPAITGDGNIVTIRASSAGQLVNINYTNPNSPYVVDVTPKDMWSSYQDTAYPMAISAYLDSSGRYTSAMWGPKIKPGTVKINPSANKWKNDIVLDKGFPDAGHTHDIDRWGNKLAIMRWAKDGSKYKHSIYSGRTLLSHQYGESLTQSSGTSQYPNISGSGQFITYQSNSSNIVETDKNYKTDIFVANNAGQKTATTRNELISQLADGTQANGHSTAPDISDDGRFIVYVTAATNLVTEGVGGIILHDRLFQTNTLISVNAAGVAATSYSNPSISYDGRFIAYESSDNNLTTEDTVGSNAYVYDTKTQEVRLASLSLADGSYNLTATRTTISANGDHLVFLSGDYVYRVESPFPIVDELVASVLTDERGDIFRKVTAADPTFMFPIKLTNKTSTTKKVSIINQLYYFDGTNYILKANIHPILCGTSGKGSNGTIDCINNIPTYDISPNASNPDYITHLPISLPSSWENGDWFSYFIITDEATNESTTLLLKFNK